jgi:RNA polymerase sigma-70 factor (ECF subfamily)
MLEGEHRMAERPSEGAGTGRRKTRTEGGPSDHSLLRRFRAGQPDAATALYLRYADRLYNLAQSQCGCDLAARVDPEDIVQSVFRTFFRRVVSGDYDVPEGEELWKLFLVIALNKVRSTGEYHRAAKRDVRLTKSGVVYDEAVQNAQARDDVALETLQLVIQDILQTLPTSQRAIIELRIEGYGVEEIAKSAGRAKRFVERALQEFRGKLSSLIDEGM